MRHWKTCSARGRGLRTRAVSASSHRWETGLPPAAPRGRLAMPVPVTSVIKKTIPVYLEYSARTELIREVSLQAKVAGYIQSQAADGRRREGRRPALQDRRPRLSAALDQAKAQAQRDVAALIMPIEFQSRRRTGQNRLPRQGQLRSARQRAGPERGVGGDGQGRHSLGGNQSGLYRIRAPLPDASAATARRSERSSAAASAQHAGATRSALRDIQSQRARSRRNPDRRSGRTVVADFSSPRRSGTPQRRADLHRQRGRPHDRHDHRAGDHSQCRSHASSGSICPCPLCFAKPDALLVPQTALGSSQLGKYVYVVGQENKAEQRLVTLGPTDGDLVPCTGSPTATA